MPDFSGFPQALESIKTPGLVLLACLCLVSVLAWTIIITRYMVLRQARRRNAEYMDLYRTMRHPLDIFEQGLDRRGTPMYSVYAACARELCLQMIGTAERDDTFSLRLRHAQRVAPTQMQSVQLSMERAIGEMATRLEERMILLAACVTGAPFLGLLGTVWGVMDTFASIAAAGKTATLQDIAPGIAAAMASSVVGLLIAIPAMFAYNLLVQAIKKMVMQLDHHAAELAAACERHYVDHRPLMAFGLPAPSLAIEATTHDVPAAKPETDASPAPHESAPIIIPMPDEDADAAEVTCPVDTRPPEPEPGDSAAAADADVTTTEPFNRSMPEAAARPEPNEPDAPAAVQTEESDLPVLPDEPSPTVKSRTPEDVPPTPVPSPATQDTMLRASEADTDFPVPVPLRPPPNRFRMRRLPFEDPAPGELEEADHEDEDIRNQTRNPSARHEKTPPL